LRIGWPSLSAKHADRKGNYNQRGDANGEPESMALRGSNHPEALQASVLRSAFKGNEHRLHR
jgi:hypothetical protein